ncbi:MAG: hypothetical protein ED859_07595 [Desulfuromonadales bacterium]|nr:MAG: hypothetical protein ED859_07595 [Desulfuromonadales bacterium]
MTNGTMTFAIVALGFALAACATAVPPRPSLAYEDLATATFRTAFAASGVATLSRGIYRERPVPEAATETIIRLDLPLATGDLNSDGDPDAVVVLISDPGGSGTFYELAAVVNDQGKPRHIASTLLGDRVRVVSLSIHSGVIRATLLTHDPGDPALCSRKEDARSYRLDGDRLVQVWGATL